MRISESITIGIVIEEESELKVMPEVPTNHHVFFVEKNA